MSDVNERQSEKRGGEESDEKGEGDKIRMRRILEKRITNLNQWTSRCQSLDAEVSEPNRRSKSIALNPGNPRINNKYQILDFQKHKQLGAV